MENEKAVAAKELNEIVEKSWDQILTQIADLRKPGGLNPIKDPKQYKAQLREEFTQEAARWSSEFEARARKGMLLIWDTLKRENPSSISEALKEMSEVCDLAENSDKDPKAFFERVDNTTCLRELMGFSPETMNSFYSIAYGFHESKHLEEASNAFYFLCSIDPLVHNFWVGYGHAEQMLERYPSALHAYAMAVLTNDANPLPHYLAGECYMEMKDYKEAKHSLDLAIECARKDLAHAALVKTAEEKKQKLAHR